MKKTCLFIIFLLPGGLLFSQKMLLLEKAEKVRPTKFYVGDELTYKLSDAQPTYFTDEITAIFPEENALVLGIQKVKIEDIAALKFRRHFLNGLGKQFVLFGVQLGFYSTVGLLFYKDKSAKKVLAIGGATVVSSVLVLKIFKNKKVKMGKKYRLRTIEVPTTF